MRSEGLRKGSNSKKQTVELNKIVIENLSLEENSYLKKS